MNNFYLSHEYVQVHCGADGCDQDFAMSQRFYDKTRRTGEGWYCPAGHSRVWRGETTEHKLKAAQARNSHLEDQLRASEAEAEATRLRLLRDRHRFANGVCPCCNRSFMNVMRHMKTQHPSYDPADLKAGETRYECSCGRSFTSLQGLRIHQGRSRSESWNDPAERKWRRHLTVVGA